MGPLFSLAVGPLFSPAVGPLFSPTVGPFFWLLLVAVIIQSFIKATCIESAGHAWRDVLMAFHELLVANCLPVYSMLTHVLRVVGWTDQHRSSRRHPALANGLCMDAIVLCTS